MVLAFPVSKFTSSHVPSRRIHFSIGDDDLGSNARENQQRLHNNKEDKRPQRRIFLERAALIAATTITGGVSQLPTISLVANAMDADTKNAAAASAEGGIKVSKKAQGGGLAQRIRSGVCFKMDELQRDLMQERWDLLPPYPAQLRSYVTVFTTYTDAAFPSDSPSDYGLRVALRYEVGRFFASVERLKRAIAKQSLEEAYTGELRKQKRAFEAFKPEKSKNEAVLIAFLEPMT